MSSAGYDPQTKKIININLTANIKLNNKSLTISLFPLNSEIKQKCVGLFFASFIQCYTGGSSQRY